MTEAFALHRAYWKLLAQSVVVGAAGALAAAVGWSVCCGVGPEALMFGLTIEVSGVPAVAIITAYVAVHGTGLLARLQRLPST